MAWTHWRIISDPENWYPVANVRADDGQRGGRNTETKDVGPRTDPLVFFTDGGMMRRCIAALVLAVTLAACGDDGGPSIPSASGTWSGGVGSATLTLTLTEDDGAVTGAGSLAGPGGSIALTAQGTHAHPSMSLTLTSQGFEDLNFQGEFVDDDSVDGRLNGSGYQNDAITLRR